MALPLLQINCARRPAGLAARFAYDVLGRAEYERGERFGRTYDDKKTAGADRRVEEARLQSKSKGPIMQMNRLIVAFGDLKNRIMW
jgi:hypothetical protein